MDIVSLMGNRISMKIGVRSKIMIRHGTKIKTRIKTRMWTGMGIRFK